MTRIQNMDPDSSRRPVLSATIGRQDRQGQPSQRESRQLTIEISTQHLRDGYVPGKRNSPAQQPQQTYRVRANDQYEKQLPRHSDAENIRPQNWHQSQYSHGPTQDRGVQSSRRLEKDLSPANKRPNMPPHPPQQSPGPVRDRKNQPSRQQAESCRIINCFLGKMRNINPHQDPPAANAEAKGSPRTAHQSMQRVSKQQRAAPVGVPPAVPDPPQRQRVREPPPTPRPSKLESPDLSDIEGENFCPYDQIGKNVNGTSSKNKMDTQRKRCL